MPPVPAIIPFLPLIGAGVATGGQILGSILNRNAQVEANRKNVAFQEMINAQNIAFQRETNALNRQYALEDWSRINQYNHPAQQMQRLKEAGLNPHLVYGQGTATQSALIRSSDAKAPQAGAPQVNPVMTTMPDFLGLFNGFMQTILQQAEAQNKQATNSLLQQQLRMNETKMAGMEIANDLSELKLTQNRALFDSAIEKARLSNHAIQTQIDKNVQEVKYAPLRFQLQLQEMRLKQAKTSAEISQAIAQTMRLNYQTQNIDPLTKRKLETEITNMEKTGQLKDFDILLRKNGLNPSDPAYMRIVISLATQLAEQFGIKLDETGSRMPNLGDVEKVLPHLKFPNKFK